MPLLTREDLQQWRRRQKVVDVPQLGDGAQVIVAEMSGLDATDYYAEYRRYERLPEEDRTRRAQLEMMALVIERSVVDESHAPLFDQGGFLAMCGGLGAEDTWALASAIFGAAMEISGLAVADDESAEGNGGSLPSDDSLAA